MPSRSRSLFQKFDRVVFSSVKYFSYVSGVCLVGIMLVAFFNVLGEKILKTGIPASMEIISYLHIPVVFLAAAYVALDNGHTKIDLVSSHFPPLLQRITTTAGYMIGAAICAFVGWRGFARMLTFILRHQKSSTTGVGFALWPFALILGLGFMLLAVSFLWCIVRQYAGDFTSDGGDGDDLPPLSGVSEGGGDK